MEHDTVNEYGMPAKGSSLREILHVMEGTAVPALRKNFKETVKRAEARIQEIYNRALTVGEPNTHGRGLFRRSFWTC
eukprot:4261857-Pleurochrysis_carterae.AAC.1